MFLVARKCIDIKREIENWEKQKKNRSSAHKANNKTYHFGGKKKSKNNWRQNHRFDNILRCCLQMFCHVLFVVNLNVTNNFFLSFLCVCVDVCGVYCFLVWSDLWCWLCAWCFLLLLLLHAVCIVNVIRFYFLGLFAHSAIVILCVCMILFYSNLLRPGRIVTINLLISNKRYHSCNWEKAATTGSRISIVIGWFGRFHQF